MARKSKETEIPSREGRDSERVEKSRTPAILKVAKRGIKDFDDVTAMGCALLEDLALDDSFDPQRANAMTKAANLIVKTVEIRIRANKSAPQEGSSKLRLVAASDNE